MNLKLLKSNKGQAFSTFQLLIAAVVALAILGILLPMITGPGIGSSPEDAIQEKLNTAPDKPGTLMYTDPIEFSSEDTPAVHAATVTRDTGFDQNQLIFLTNGLDNHFEVASDNSFLKTKTSQKVEYKIGVLCADNYEDLTTFVSGYDLEIITELEITTENAENTYYLDANARVCVIFPKKV
jgi:hypothetical protein